MHIPRFVFVPFLSCLCISLAAEGPGAGGAPLAVEFLLRSEAARALWPIMFGAMGAGEPGWGRGRVHWRDVQGGLAPSARFLSSRNDAVHIRADNPLNAAGSGGPCQVGHGESPIAPSLAQRLDRHLESDPIPCLEQIGDGFRHTVDANRSALDPVNLDPLVKSRAAKSDNAQPKIRHRRRSTTSFDCHPHFSRELTADFVKGECGKQADDALRRCCRHQCKAMAFGDFRIGKPIYAGTDAIQRAIGHQPGELLRVDARPRDLGRGDMAVRCGLGQDTLPCGPAHVDYCIQMFVNVNILPQMADSAGGRARPRIKCRQIRVSADDFLQPALPGSHFRQHPDDVAFDRPDICLDRLEGPGWGIPIEVEVAVEVDLVADQTEFLGAGENAFEPAQHSERENHVLLFAALEGVADQVGEAPEEGDDFGVIQGSVPGEGVEAKLNGRSF